MNFPKNTALNPHAPRQDTREIEQVRRLYGRSPVELLERLGLLDERLIAAH